ncbi:uncharacterized protein LAJ45_01010 [Morchella importuna]|uniref:uncharacterized protein n=1 Tax=Morchella importuna TaxID=1174673 RepID=UPI001E8EAEBB|nr:uncharacterized protein LAJ45_01010 [Morchella importuna]KAH8154483.1 hypothetical protein LAJ45_01010 [Morchella importuna]
MTKSWNPHVSHYKATLTMHTVNSRDRSPFSSIEALGEALRRTPPPALPARDENASPPPATDPFYLPRLGKTHASDIHLYERFVGWYDFWNMHKRIFLKYGYLDNPLYEVINAADIDSDHLPSLCQVPSILHMQSAVRDLCWNEKSRVTNVARGGLNRLIIWVEINRVVWLPRDWFENLRVEGGGVVGKDNGKRYITACTSKKDKWYATKREQLAGFSILSTRPSVTGA